MSNTVQKWLERKSFSPLRDFSQMQESLERLMSDFPQANSPINSELNSFIPSCEVSEEEDKIVMKFDLPGVEKGNVSVETSEGQLTVRAERKEERQSESKKKYLSEVRYGSYSRSFSLASPIDEKNIEAKFENGVLTVVLPKAAVSKAKQIPIH